MFDPSQYHYPISIARNTLPAYGLPYFPFQVYGYPGGRVYQGSRLPSSFRSPDQELLDRYREPRIIRLSERSGPCAKEIFDEYWPTVGASLLIAMLLFR